MDNQNQPNLEKSDDLIKADARAFVASGGLTPDANKQGSSESVKSGADEDNPVSQAVQHVQALRAENNKRKPVLLYVAVAMVLILIVGLSLLLSSKNQNNSSNSSSNSSSSAGALSIPTPANSDTQDLSNQAQQDIKTCSNLVNATIEC